MNAILLPIVLPLLGAIACLVMARSLPAQRFIAGTVAVLQPVVSFSLLYIVHTDGVLTVRAGNWPDAFGIVFVLDLFGAIMLCLTAVTQLAAFAFVACGAMPPEKERFLIHPLFLLLGMGVNWAFCTGDLFNLFVSFEIILLTNYVLLVQHNEAPPLREGFKYVILNLIASTLFLVSAGYAYGMFGALNMADLALHLAQAGYPPEATILGTMLLVTFGMKAALFPMFFWLPDAYPKAPPGVVAYFSGILTKVGVYCLYRVFTLLFRDPAAMESWFQPLILAIGGGTMLVGVLCALAQMTMRRILSFHIISQIGYMIFALGLFTPVALASGIFYIIHHIIVKASLFLVADAVKTNEGTQELEKLGGLVAIYPGLAIAFLFAALSLAGIPPLSGFYGKYGLVVEGLREGWWPYVVVSLLTSLFTLMSMVKIWRYAFWGEREDPVGPRNTGVIAATWGLVAVSILVAVFSGPVMWLATETSEQLLSRDAYIQAVLGAEGVATLDAAMEAPRP